jgi:TM2 domain-containing membrane protein YozV
MTKHELRARVKSTGVAYLFFLFFGAHYAYLGRWGTQILYWLTLGGLGFWALIDLFLLGGKVEKSNAKLYAEIDTMERREREAEHAQQLAMIAAARG